MNWDDLRLFVILARSQRLATAARLAGLDATTVSRRIRRLEHDLGTRLFEQSGDGLLLTAKGSRIFDRVERAEGHLRAVADGREQGADTLSGTIRISVSEGFGTWVLAPLLADFHRAYPRVEVELIASNGFLNPSRREADLAIMLARPARGPLLTRKLADYRLGLYAARDYLAERGPIASLADVPHHTIVGYVPDLIYAPELAYLDEIGAGLRATLRSSSVNAQAELIAAGAGCGVLPCFIGERTAALVRCLPAVDIARSFWLVYHRNLKGIARIDRFIEWLLAAIGGKRALLLGIPA